MRILFLDQSGQLGGAELSLMDVAHAHRHHCLVGLLQDGPFRHQLEQREIPVQVLSTQLLQVSKQGSWLKSLKSIRPLLPLIYRVAQLSRHYDVIYANTQRALVVGAFASLLSRRPLVYHLRDILSREHFSATNLRLAVSLANHFANRVITNSYATKDAFIAAGGRAELATVIYNGFDVPRFLELNVNAATIRQQLKLEGRRIVGHFSRLSPWKGQHVLIDALCHCPDNVVAVFVGDALFGEQAYVEQLHAQVATLGLQHRVKFLGFRHEVTELMAACDLVAHTSTSPEPFGRVIIEAMLCGTPIVATAAGGVLELIEHGKTGWLTPPHQADKLANIITHCLEYPQQASEIANQAQTLAMQQFHLNETNQEITHLLEQLLAQSSSEMSRLSSTHTSIKNL